MSGGGLVNGNGGRGGRMSAVRGGGGWCVFVVWEESGGTVLGEAVCVCMVGRNAVVLWWGRLWSYNL